MDEDILYKEIVTSKKTEAIFIMLTLLFYLLLFWRVNAAGMDILAFIFFAFFVTFLFYSIYYRTLIIQIFKNALKLKFGIFTWKIPLENIAGYRLDDVPLLMRYGGAGIHFMSIKKRYRASFNFLEYPRVVVSLKKKAGLVRDISFSTSQPDKVLGVIERVKGLENGDSGFNA